MWMDGQIDRYKYTYLYLWLGQLNTLSQKADCVTSIYRPQKQSVNSLLPWPQDITK